MRNVSGMNAGNIDPLDKGWVFTPGRIAYDTEFNPVRNFVFYSSLTDSYPCNFFLPIQMRAQDILRKMNKLCLVYFQMSNSWQFRVRTDNFKCVKGHWDGRTSSGVWVLHPEV